jgi:hypothetical protein
MQIIHIKYDADLRQLKSTMLFISCITGITINYNYIELDYTRNIIYQSEQPFVDQSGGIFILSDLIGNLFSSGNASIDSNSGITFINSGIQVTRNLLQTTYTLNNSFNTINTTYIIKPVFYYTISALIINYSFISNSVIPNTYPNGGSFIIDNSNVKIDFNSGIIYFNNNIDVGNYSYLITYIVNKISSSNYYNLTVLSNINYPINNITFNYDNSANSIIPIYSQRNGYFTIYDFSNNYVSNNLVNINLDGIIYFLPGIDVGQHSFIIDYNLNNVDSQTIYNINVLPILKYSPSNIYLLYDRQQIIYSFTPSYKQLNGYFIIQDYIGDLVFNNYINIDSISGIITFNGFINVDVYEVVVYYYLNNLNTFTFITITVLPNLTFTNYNLNLFFGNGGTSDLPIVAPLNGYFTIFDTSGSILVSNNLVTINVNTGLINVDSIILVGNYQFIIQYTIINLISNIKLSSSVNYYLNVSPILNYSISNKSINYGDTARSVIPNINPSNGYFYLNMDF